MRRAASDWSHSASSNVTLTVRFLVLGRFGGVGITHIMRAFKTHVRGWLVRISRMSCVMCNNADYAYDAAINKDSSGHNR